MLQRDPLQIEIQDGRSTPHQCPRCVIGVAAFLGILATFFTCGLSTAGSVKWGAGNGYPFGPYSSPDEACATALNDVGGPAEAWGPDAYFLNSNAVANPAGWDHTPVGGYSYSATYCNFTETIYDCGKACPHVMQITNGLPYVYAISASSKEKSVTLSDLISQSQVIVYGHVSASTNLTSSAPANGRVPFKTSQVLKGGRSIQAGVVLLCSPRPNGEAPDAATPSGENILFLARHGNCFAPLHDRISVANGGQVSTATIDDQPDAQPLEVFVKKVRALVSEQARASQ